jgi:hypothetical protein
MIATLALGIIIGVVLSGIAVIVVVHFAEPEPVSPPQRVGAIGVDLSGQNNGGLIDVHYQRLLQPILAKLEGRNE